MTKLQQKRQINAIIEKWFKSLALINKKHSDGYETVWNAKEGDSFESCLLYHTISNSDWILGLAIKTLILFLLGSLNILQAASNSVDRAVSSSTLYTHIVVFESSVWAGDDRLWC